jgi:dihydrofolate synthase/folylpolyglutamate synthase
MRASRSRLDAWLARLESYSPTEINLGLERVAAVLKRLDIELPGTLFIVGGTNGKGSSVVLLEALLDAGGYRTGSYLSPHIQRYNERIRVAGEEATDDAIVEAFELVETVRGDVPLTYFEYGTLAAFVVFARAALDAVVLEVGMGGRLDAVNVVEPTASLITNVALDHCAWLGNDVEAIGAEKAGIMRAGKPTVFAGKEPPRSVCEHAERLGARLVLAGRDYDWSTADNGWTWRGARHVLEGLARPALAGDIQLRNAAGILALAEAAGLDELLERPVVDRALGRVRLDGRMQSVRRGGDWLLDVAHNPAAAAVLAEALAARPVSGKTVAVIGMLDDKDVDAVAAALASVVETWIALTADSRRAIPANELARRIANVTGRPCLAATTIQEALDHARRLVGADGRVVVTGSFYTVGPVLQALEESP